MESYEDEYCVTQNSGRPKAKAWLEENGTRLHPALSSTSRYDDQRSQSTPRKSQGSDIVQQHIDHFQKAIDIYQSSVKEKALRDLDVRNAHSWDDISREYEDAQRKYSEKSTGWLGLPRRMGRAVGDKASSVYPFLTFIPQGTYTDVLRAGLFLIFGAANRLSERRQHILETLGGIPFLIQNAEYSFEDFATDEKLKEEIVELYLVILQAIMAMMEWLVEKSVWRRSIKVLLQGPGYEKDLTDMIQSIHQRSLFVQRRVERLNRGTVVATAATTKRTGEQVEKLGPAVGNIATDTSAIKSIVQTMKMSITQMITKDEAFSHLVDVLAETSRTSEWNQKRWQEEERKKGELERQRREEARRREDAERSKQETEGRLRIAEDRLKQVSSHQGMVVKTGDLLAILAVDPTQILKHSDETVRQGQVLGHAVHGRSHFLMRSPKFQQWLSSAQSRCLLVDGNAQSSMDRVSAMTVVCALLTQSLPSQTASTITFFCGLHIRQDSPYSGPCDLVRNLLAQLINTYRLSTSFIDGRAYHELQSFDLQRLCALFDEMVKKLPHGAVLFCLVDGISWYENEQWVNQTRLVIQTINDLTQNPNVRAVFKTLITSPLASRYIRHCIPEQDHLSLPHEVAECDGSPLSKRHLMMQASRQTVETFDDFVEEDEGYDEGIFDEGNVGADDI